MDIQSWVDGMLGLRKPRNPDLLTDYIDGEGFHLDDWTADSLTPPVEVISDEQAIGA